jgi:sirohydrochlorin cobaltochelatase
VAARCPRAAPDARVRLAFLEFMAPDLVAGAATPWWRPAAPCVDVVPLFLGAGGHVRKDLPVLLARLQEATRPCGTLRPAVGEAAALVDGHGRRRLLDSTLPEVPWR